MWADQLLAAMLNVVEYYFWSNQIKSNEKFIILKKLIGDQTFLTNYFDLQGIELR